MQSRFGFYFVVLSFNVLNNGQDNETVWLWTSLTEQGLIFTSLIGDPNNYLQCLERDNSDLCYKIQGKLLNNPDEYMSFAYDANTNFVALSKFYEDSGSIFVNFLNGDISTKETYGYEFRHLPLSDKVNGMAFAMNLNLLFWIDKTYKYIGVMELMNLHWKKILDIGSSPSSIAVHQTKRYIFWIHAYPNLRIERAYLNGRERTVIISASSDSLQLLNLAIDTNSERLFWLEDNNLKSCNLDGKDKISYTYESKDIVPNNFVVYKDLVIFTIEEFTFEFYNIKEDSQLYKLDYYITQRIVSSFIDSKDFASNTTNPCSDHGNCDHFCFPQNDVNYTCECQFGFVPNLDGRTCNVGNITDGRILVSDIKQGIIYQYDQTSDTIQAILKLYPNYANNIAYFYDSTGEYLYYTLQDKKQITRYSILNGEKLLFFNSTNNITDIAVDDTTGALYISDAHNVIRLTSSNSTQVVNNQNGHIVKFYFHPQKRHLFYIDCISKSVVRLNLVNGEESSESFAYCFTSITVDYNGNNVYLGTGDRSVWKYKFAEDSSDLLHNSMRMAISELTVDDKYLYVAYKRYIFMLNLTPSNLPKQSSAWYNEAKDILVLIKESVTMSQQSTAPKTESITTTQDSTSSKAEVTTVVQDSKGLIIGLSVAGAVAFGCLSVLVAACLYRTVNKRKSQATIRQKTDKYYDDASNYNDIIGKRESKYPSEYDEIQERNSTYDEILENKDEKHHTRSGGSASVDYQIDVSPHSVDSAR